MTDRLVADTSVMSRLTKYGPELEFYTRVIAGRQIAVSFQTLAEFLSANYGPARQAKLDELLGDGLSLPHSWNTSLHYAHISSVRKILKRRQDLGGDAADGDVWVLASAMEYFLPLVSHDRQQIALGRAAGLDVLTNLPGLRETNPALA